MRAGSRCSLSKRKDKKVTLHCLKYLRTSPKHLLTIPLSLEICNLNQSASSQKRLLIHLHSNLNVLLYEHVSRLSLFSLSQILRTMKLQELLCYLHALIQSYVPIASQSCALAHLELLANNLLQVACCSHTCGIGNEVGNSWLWRSRPFSASCLGTDMKELGVMVAHRITEVLVGGDHSLDLQSPVQTSLRGPHVRIKSAISQ